VTGRGNGAEPPAVPARMTRLLLPFVALLPLAGCGDPAPQPRATPAETGYIAKVQALSPREREGVLFRAIQSGGGNQKCHEVTQVEAMPPAKGGQPNWRVTCTGGGQWLVALSDNGIAQVTGAADR